MCCLYSSIIINWQKSSSPLQTNTFQGVLVTNTTVSFYGFSYACGDIEWSGQGFETAIIGYNSRADYFFNHPANGIPDIGQIVSCTRQIIPTGGRRKRQVITEVDDDEPAYGPVPCNEEVKGNAEMCMGLALLDQASIPDANNLVDTQNHPIFDVLPACPPTKDLVEINAMFERLIESTRDCYRSTVEFQPINPNGRLLRPYRFASICCYDTNR